MLQDALTHWRVVRIESPFLNMTLLLTSIREGKN